MRMTRLAGMAITVALFAGPALAQSADQTGTGGGPATAAKAPYTASTGATVPRPGTVDAAESGRIDRRTKNDEQDDKISQGICIGCGPK